MLLFSFFFIFILGFILTLCIDSDPFGGFLIATFSIFVYFGCLVLFFDKTPDMIKHTDSRYKAVGELILYDDGVDNDSIPIIRQGEIDGIYYMVNDTLISYEIFE